MATKLGNKVTRVTEGKHRGRTLVVTLYPGDVIGVRQSRLHKEYTIPLAWVFDLAVKAAVQAAKAEKAKAKKEAKR